jgi:mannose-6-phosphate isomerase-like protein (cupin superfamily)
MTGARVIDLAALAKDAGEGRPVWSGASEDLNLNLVVLQGDSRVEEHVNNEVDVLLVGVEGSGSVHIDDASYSVVAGQMLVIPKSTRRSIACSGARFAYLLCHRRRAGLWPAGVPRR